MLNCSLFNVRCVQFTFWRKCFLNMAMLIGSAIFAFCLKCWHDSSDIDSGSNEAISCFLAHDSCRGFCYCLDAPFNGLCVTRKSRKLDSRSFLTANKTSNSSPHNDLVAGGSMITQLCQSIISIYSVVSKFSFCTSKHLANGSWGLELAIPAWFGVGPVPKYYQIAGLSSVNIVRRMFSWRPK